MQERSQVATAVEPFGVACVADLPVDQNQDVVSQTPQLAEVVGDPQLGFCARRATCIMVVPPHDRSDKHHRKSVGPLRAGRDEETT